MRRLTRSIGAVGALYHVVRFSILGAVTVAWAGFWNDISLGLIAVTFGAPGLAIAGVFLGLLIHPAESKALISVALFSTFVIFSTDVAALARQISTVSGPDGATTGLTVVLACDGFLFVVLLVFGLWRRNAKQPLRDQVCPSPDVEEVENP